MQHYLDEVTILANPERALALVYLVRRSEHHLAFHTRLSPNLFKTAIWNGVGVASGAAGRSPQPTAELARHIGRVVALVLLRMPEGTVCFPHPPHFQHTCVCSSS